MKAKDIAVVAGLLIVIAGAVVFIVKKQAGLPPPPEWIAKEPVEKIDKNDLTLVTKPLGEWEKLGKKDGMYKNPETGKYTMVDPITCGSCGEKIPPPDYPPPPSMEDIPEGVAPYQVMEEYAQHNNEILKAYICPKCGKRAFGSPER